MTTSEAILARLQALPESAQQEILDFVEFLASRPRTPAGREDDTTWSEFSLASAMRGMEEEDSPYSLADLKESFR